MNPIIFSARFIYQAEFFAIKTLMTLSFLTVFMCLASPSMASDTLDVKGTLSRPGVKLLAVDVYATWCEPCMAAMPKWKALREKYHDKGLRVVMVHTQDPDTQCGAGVSDFADDVICDEKRYVANWLRVNKKLPAAFLWSWQGNLLVKSGHVGGVTTKIEEYFKELPRVEIGAVGTNNKPDEMLFDLVRSELHRASKLTLVATDEERKVFKQMRIKSLKGGGSKDTECDMG